jgi:hypothetical protein
MPLKHALDSNLPGYVVYAQSYLSNQLSDQHMPAFLDACPSSPVLDVPIVP